MTSLTGARPFAVKYGEDPPLSPAEGLSALTARSKDIHRTFSPASVSTPLPPWGRSDGPWRSPLEASRNRHSAEHVGCKETGRHS